MKINFIIIIANSIIYYFSILVKFSFLFFTLVAIQAQHRNSDAAHKNSGDGANLGDAYENFLVSGRDAVPVAGVRDIADGQHVLLDALPFVAGSSAEILLAKPHASVAVSAVGAAIAEQRRGNVSDAFGADIAANRLPAVDGFFIAVAVSSIAAHVADARNAAPDRHSAVYGIGRLNVPAIYVEDAGV